MTVSQAQPTAQENVVTIDRRRGDRRGDQLAAPEAKSTPAARPKKPRRRHIDPTTCERDYSDQEIEFMRAMDDYKRDAGRMFPTCSEVLEVIRSLGYYQLNDEQLDQLGFTAEPAEEPRSDVSEEQAEEETLDA